MDHEKTFLAENCNITYTEYMFFSDQRHLFNIRGIEYDRLIVIFGKERAHWSYYRLKPTQIQLYGSDKLPVNACSCCFYLQYIDVAYSVRSYTEELITLEENRLENERVPYPVKKATTTIKEATMQIPHPIKKAISTI